MLLTVSSLVQPMQLAAQVRVPYIPADRVSVTVDTNVTYDAATALYTYAYTLSSAPTSEQEAWYFALELAGDVMPEIKQPTSPAGWRFGIHQDQPVVSWAATEGPPPPDWVDEGQNVPPSPFQLKPGQTLAGFSFKSPDPPASVKFFAQGFTPIPSVTSDASELGEEIPDWTEDSFTGIASGPKGLVLDQPFLGGRRPSVDGFLAFLNIHNDETLTSLPVAVAVKFSVSGETVDRTTFHAELNGMDVTRTFQETGGAADLVAIFDLGSPPLKRGRNVLITSVRGFVPDTSRTADDTDRITFFVPDSVP
ncbi:MAG TPA: hypothetical protein VNK82_09385 [Terriglobales bacterium]|nr:hypothetical protein [Terriglobales bacterium]